MLCLITENMKKVGDYMKDEELARLIMRRLSNDDVAAQYYVLKELYPRMTKIAYARVVGVTRQTLDKYLNAYNSRKEQGEQ